MVACRRILQKRGVAWQWRGFWLSSKYRMLRRRREIELEKVEMVGVVVHGERRAERVCYRPVGKGSSGSRDCDGCECCDDDRASDDVASIGAIVHPGSRVRRQLCR